MPPRKKREKIAPDLPPTLPTAEDLPEPRPGDTLDLMGQAPEGVLNESTYARWIRVGGFVAAADAAGVSVPQIVRDSVPTLAELAQEYRRLKATLNLLERVVGSKGLLRAHLVAAYEAGQWGGEELKDGETPLLVMGSGFSGGGVDVKRLIELGVDPDVIDRATDPGTPYYKILVAGEKE